MPDKKLVSRNTLTEEQIINHQDSRLKTCVVGVVVSVDPSPEGRTPLFSPAMSLRKFLRPPNGRMPRV